MNLSLASSLKELWQYRYLVTTFVIRDIKSRYRQTKLGVAWAIVQPLFMTVVFTIIFSKFLKVSTGGVPYPVFSFVALSVWTFFSRVITTGANSLIYGGSLIKKIYFPREVLPLSDVISSLVDFGIASMITVLLIVVYRVDISGYIVFLPVVLMIQLLLACALVLLSSSLTVIFRDLEFAIPFLVQLLMYASPVIYSARNIRQPLQTLLYLNPITGVIEGYRSILIYKEAPNFIFLAVSTFFALVILIIAYIIFKRIERYLADVI